MSGPESRSPNLPYYELLKDALNENMSPDTVLEL